MNKRSLLSELSMRLRHGEWGKLLSPHVMHVTSPNRDKRMRRALALALAFSAATFPALAEDSNGSGLRPFIGAGFTWGGDTIQAWKLIPQGTTTEYEEDISAGSGLDLRLGLSYRLGDTPLTLQGSVGYHNDQASGLNSNSRFRRYPIELLLQWHVSEKGRLGFGVRRAVNASLSSKGGTCDNGLGGTYACPRINEDMKSSTGLVIEGEWMVSPSWGLKARYVHENYRFKDSTFDSGKYEGDHFGVMTSVYFN